MIPTLRLSLPLKVVEEDGEEIMAMIEDEDELDEIYDIFSGRLADLYEFEDDEEED